MTFTDDDLKRLKEEIGPGGFRPRYLLHAMQALS